MTGSAGRTRYTAVAIALHWIVAAVIATNFGLGLYMAQLEASPAKLRLYSYHKTIGVTIFLLVVFRLVWRLTYRVPAPRRGCRDGSVQRPRSAMSCCTC